jgi:hypothetical protein
MGVLVIVWIMVVLWGLLEVTICRHIKLLRQSVEIRLLVGKVINLVAILVVYIERLGLITEGLLLRHDSP